MTQSNSDKTINPTAKRKIVIGGIVFVAGQVSPLIFIPLVLSLDLSTGWTTALSGILMFGIPELAILAAIAIMGKEGFNFIKSKAFGYIKKIAPPDQVSSARYKIGLIMFIIPFLIALLLPYFTSMISDYDDFAIYINVGGDLLLVSSLFVLGGDFWDKIRAIFIQNAKIDKS